MYFQDQLNTGRPIDERALSVLKGFSISLESARQRRRPLTYDATKALFSKSSFLAPAAMYLPSLFSDTLFTIESYYFASDAIKALIDYASLETASKKLDIFGSMTVSPCIAGGRTYPIEDGKRTILFSGVDGRSTAGVLVHELTHDAVYSLYGSYSPYSIDEDEQKTLMIIESSLAVDNLEGSDIAILPLMKEVFHIHDLYDDGADTISAELIARVPQALLLYGEQGKEELETHFPQLMDRWNEVIFPKLLEYNMSHPLLATESHRELARSIHTSPDTPPSELLERTLAIIATPIASISRRAMQ